MSSFELFIELLLKWNEKINLTAITDPGEMRIKHIEDSLALLPYIKDAKTILDLGSGAGFPGIPLKMERPSLDVTLLEATRKKVSFLQAAIAQLGLKGITAVCGRAEDPAVIERLGTFDVVVSRATWELGRFIPLALPYLCPSGKIVAMKGAKWEEELSSARKTLEQTKMTATHHHYSLTNGDERALVVITKTSS